MFSELFVNATNFVAVEKERRYGAKAVGTGFMASTYVVVLKTTMAFGRV